MLHYTGTFSLDFRPTLAYTASTNAAHKGKHLKYTHDVPYKIKHKKWRTTVKQSNQE
jgi:hypothetical protein